MKLQTGISKRKLRGMVGQTVEVLLEGVSGESDLLLQGRTEAQAPEIDGHVLINDCGDLQPRAGEFFPVEITESMEYDLIGRIV
jgi:ribosomal protein S12 methylthiotransferase